MWRGKLIPALAHFEQALALYDQADHDASMLLGMSDARVLCLGLTACVRTWQGHPDQALLPSRQSCAAAHQLSHAFTRAHALHMSCWFHQVRGDRRVVLERAAAMMALTAEHGFASWHAVATIFHGWALVDGDEIESGITEMRRGLAALQATGMELQVPHCLGLLASACTRANDPAALDLLAEALERVDRTEERWFEAELYRLKGEALLALSPERSAEAEVDYRQALVVARSQGARVWELRAATSLARLWRDQGRLAEAHDLLAPVYGWFTKGFDTPDLEDARALLDALA
jgi:predicted ATPase